MHAFKTFLTLWDYFIFKFWFSGGIFLIFKKKNFVQFQDRKNV